MHRGSSAQVFWEGGSNRLRSRWHRAHGGQPPTLGFFFYPFIRLGAGWAVTPEEPVVDGEGWEPFMGGWGMPGAVGAWCAVVQVVT